MTGHIHKTKFSVFQYKKALCRDRYAGYNLKPSRVKCDF